jgi:hypothetical protein
MPIEYTNVFHSKALQNLPIVGFLFLKSVYHLATLVGVGIGTVTSKLIIFAAVVRSSRSPE